MTLRALVTRPEEDAAPLAAALAERGIEVAAEPLLTIRPIADAAVDLEGVQALLFTSANGVRAFATLSERRDLPAFAVGDATAATAREAGFAQVESASGDVAALAQLVAGRLDPAAGALFHAAGSAVAGDLAGLLEQSGFTLRRTMLYEAKPAEQLSSTAVTKLANGELDLVLFFSPRTAQTFVALARAAGPDVVKGCSQAIALCLSPAVAATAGELSWRDIRAAARPELPALLDLIDAELAARAQNVDAGEAARGQVFADSADARSTSDSDAVDMKTPPSRGAGPLWWRVAAVAGIVAAVIAGIPYVYNGLLGTALDISTQSALEVELANRLSRLEERVQAVEAQMPPREDAALENLRNDMVDTRNRVIALETAQSEVPLDAAALKDRLDAAEKEIASLRVATQGPPQSGNPAEVAALTDRITALEARLASQPATADPSGTAADSAVLEKLATENAALRDQLSALAAQLDSLKGVGERLDALDRAVAARPGDGGATLVLAVSNLGAALATARPFAAELGAVTQIAASDPALAAKVAELTAPLGDRAAAGIPTLVDLRMRFDATAQAIVDAEKAATAAPAEPEPKEWFDRQLDWLSSAADAVLSDVSVRPVGDVPGDGPGPRVARAEVRLAENALAAAVAELEGLTGAPAEAAAPWLADARARLAVEQVMAGLQAALATRTGAGG